MVQFHQLLKRLHDADVEFVIIGGFAAVLHGSGMGTFDVDVCAPLNDENLAKIVNTLRGLHPRHRMPPQRPPLPDDPRLLKGFKNLNLLTDIGVIDLLAELPGIGSYDEIKARTVEINLGDFRCRVLDLDTLIAAKRVAGRDKDILGIHHLEALRTMRRDQPQLFDPPPPPSSE